MPVALWQCAPCAYILRSKGRPDGPFRSFRLTSARFALGAFVSLVLGSCATPSVVVEHPPVPTPVIAGVVLEAPEETGAHLTSSAIPELPPAPSAPRLPGEFEPVDHVLVGWAQDAWGYTQTFSALVRETSYRSRITLVHSEIDDLKPLRAELSRAGVNFDAITFVYAPLDSMWMRDYGPLVVRGSRGEREVVDFSYSRANDDRVPRVYADHSRLARRNVPVELEGGHIQADGTGRCILSEDALFRNREVGIFEHDLADALRENLGCEKLIVVPQLFGEETGHVDIFLYVVGPGHVLLGRYRPDDDRKNARRLDGVSRTLRRAGFKVTRIPMPSNRRRSLFRSYTNALAVDDAVFVPVYRSERRFERVALKAFSRVFPTRSVIPIVSDEVVDLGGALHCIAMTVAK